MAGETRVILKYKPDASFDPGLRKLTGAASPFRSLFLMRFMPAGGREGLTKPRSVERRTQMEALFRRDVLGGILIGECDAEHADARRLLQQLGKKVGAGYHARIEKLQSSFRRTRSRKIKRFQRTPITAIARAREKAPLQEISISSIIPNKPQLRLRQHQELIWNRPTAHHSANSISERSLHKC